MLDARRRVSTGRVQSGVLFLFALLLFLGRTLFMFGFLTRTRIKTEPAFRRRTRLGLEMLERRDCPTAGIAPAITSFAVRAMPGHLVSLSGTVSDLKPASVVVHFSGEANAAVTCYPSGAGGSFYLVTPA